MKRLFLIFLFLLISCPAWGATIDYYVRINGHDTNCNGTVDVDDSAGVRPNCAKATGYGCIQQVVTDLNGVTANSATIKIQPGTYHETHNLILSKGTHYPDIGGGTLKLHDGTASKKWTIEGNGGLATIDASAISTYQTYIGVIATNLPYTEIKNIKIVNVNDAGKDSIYFSAAPYGLVEHCYLPYWDHAIDMYKSANSIVRYNYVEGSLSDASSSAIKVQHITTDNSQVYGNIVNLAGGTHAASNHSGIDISGAIGAKVWNNTVYGSHKIGILIWESATGVQLRNNLVFGSDSYELLVTSNSQSGLDSDYNLFYRSSGKSVYWGGTFTAAGGASGGTEYTVSEFYSATGQEHHSSSSNPLTVSTTNFRLQNQSPAINRGVVVGISQDYEGKTIGDYPDIGAYEWKGVPWVK